MSENIFKNLSRQVESYLSEGEEADPRMILEEEGLLNEYIDRPAYREFIEDHIELSRNYLGEIEDMGEGLDSYESRTILGKIARMGITAIGYGMLGSLYKDPSVSEFYAYAGVSLVGLDEINYKGMDLAQIGWAGLFGGFVFYLAGEFIDPPNSTIWAYLGTALGGSLSIAEEFKESKEEYQEFKEISETLEQKREEYESKKTELMERKRQEISQPN